ncbi:MAG: CHAT domain-containing protein [Chloroflexi bacterium]|nr:CHAT domain-containing protein [Chloroflexota bacterium]
MDDSTRLEYGDLEISLHRRAGSAYTVETRFTPPGSNFETRLGANAPVEIHFDEQALSQLIARFDWMGYGRALSAALFEPEPVKMAFGQALARVGTGALRLRLLFGPTAQELHSLHWETLRNPLDDSLLAADQKILFSRYLAGSGAREAAPRPKNDVKALLAVANPQDLEEYNMAPLDVDGELGRAAESLKGMRITRLPSDTEGCTLASLARHLQDGCDILYLAAHGRLAKGQARLWLEDERGQVHHVSGAELAGQVRLLDNPPLLVVLASCESAGSSEGDALQALGPQLCEAGVPAVIAMQGKISLNSVRRAMPVFFQRLQQDGLVDRALAAARATLAASGAPDLWMPALFLRLKDGAIWQPSGETAPAHIKKLWGLIATRFQDKPAAQGAAQDLLADADDPDNQEAFSIQLKKSLRDDPDFAGELVAIIEASRKSGGNGNPGGVVISVGGNVGGSIVLGNNNTLGNITHPG